MCFDHCNAYLFRLMNSWIVSCKTVEEVRLDGNLIGESAAREVLIALGLRKEG